MSLTDDAMAKWRDLVGGFILSFGDIELTTFRLWRDHVGTKPIPHNFKERTGVLLGKLRRLGAEYEGIVNILVQALRLADKRNTVAHSPMQVQVFEHSKTGEILFEDAISSETSDDYIDDAELTELRAEAEDLATRLYMSLGVPEPKPR